MLDHSALGTHSPHTRSGRWYRLHPSLPKLVLLPAALSLYCAKPDQFVQETEPPPLLVWSPPVAYPPTMFERAVEGRVVVQATIDSAGRTEPGSIEVVSATRAEFERPAIEMVQNSRFTPAESGARTVERTVRVPVTFNLDRGSRIAPADSLVAVDLASQGESLARQGEIVEAMTVYTEALDRDARLNKSHEFWRDLCWHGSLWGDAANVMFACDQAVALAPGSTSVREARGVARALTSDFAGAIEDLEQCTAGAATSEERTEWLGWLRALRAGQNPFTEEVLEALRKRPTT